MCARRGHPWPNPIPTRFSVVQHGRTRTRTRSAARVFPEMFRLREIVFPKSRTRSRRDVSRNQDQVRDRKKATGSNFDPREPAAPTDIALLDNHPRLAGLGRGRGPNFWSLLFSENVVRKSLRALGRRRSERSRSRVDVGPNPARERRASQLCGGQHHAAATSACAAASRLAISAATASASAARSVSLRSSTMPATVAALVSASTVSGFKF